MSINDKTLGIKNLKEEKFVIFTIEKRNYGLDIKNVNQVLGYMDIEKFPDLPDIPDYFEGVLNFENKVLPVIDIRKKFTNNLNQEKKGSYIIASQINNKKVGIIVDSITEVLCLTKNDIKPANDVNSIFDNKSIKGVSDKNNEINILIDIEKVLNEKDYKLIDKFN
ncbi:MAG: chemotaxis protein CheW [Clostridiales bacterium]